MTAYAEGEPCWADAVLPDVEAGKRFYGELMGWTFGEPDPARHGYAMAFRGGRPVAALMAKPDGRMPTTWNVYFATDDAAATARAVRAADGQVIMGPEPVGRFGTMAMAVDPSGGVFGLWQGGLQTGFGERDAPGAFCWTELRTRDAEAADPFYRAVFGYRGEQIGRAGGDFDYEVWTLGEEPDAVYAGGRHQMGPELPPELPSHFDLFFGVADCDAAAAAVRALGGRVLTEPQDSPHGRLAAVADDQGAHFTVIDLSRAAGAASGG